MIDETGRRSSEVHDMHRKHTNIVIIIKQCSGLTRIRGSINKPSFSVHPKRIKYFVYARTVNGSYIYIHIHRNEWIKFLTVWAPKRYDYSGVLCEQTLLYRL